MNGLKGFLMQNAIKVKNEKCIVSDRFLDDDNKPILWEYRCITPKEDEEIRKNSLINGEVCMDKYLGLLAYTSTVFPDLNDSELQDSYNVLGGDNLLKVMLTPGEYACYLDKIETLNGFKESMKEKVDKAKN